MQRCQRHAEAPRFAGRVTIARSLELFKRIDEMLVRHAVKPPLR
jgi:hypothetical protein